MKKLAALLAVLTVLLFSAFPSFGEGIAVSSENGDRIGLFNDIRITEPVKGNIIDVLGNVTIDSKVEGQIVTVFGDATVNSEVSGQVVTIFGKTTLGSNAVVAGNVITMGSEEKAPTAGIRGQEVRIFGESMNLDISAVMYLRLAIMILFMLATLVLGLLVLFISRKKYERISRTIDKDIGRKFLLGMLTFLAASILLLLLLLTLIAPLLYIIVLLFSNITASMFLGRIILKTFSQKNSIFTEFSTGLISITLVKILLMLLVPQSDILVGFILVGLFDALVYSLGLGIHMQERFAKTADMD